VSFDLRTLRIKLFQLILLVISRFLMSGNNVAKSGIYSLLIRELENSRHVCLKFHCALYCTVTYPSIAVVTVLGQVHDALVVVLRLAVDDS